MSKKCFTLLQLNCKLSMKLLRKINNNAAVPGRDSLLSGEKRRNGFGCFVVSIAGSVNSIPACVVSGRIAANPSFRRGVFRFFRRVGKKSSDRTTPIWPTKAYGMARNVRLVVFLRRKPGG